jgi:uncharacterized integral membrane protein
MSAVRFVAAAVLFLGLLFLSLDNADTVTLRFFHLYELQAPLIFVLLCTFAIGIALGLVAGVLRTARVRRELRTLRREVQQRDNDAGAARVTRPPLDAL